MTNPTAPVLVTGATGRQGGATARSLLARGVPVRALVRTPDSDAARSLVRLGVDVVQGDLLDIHTVRSAAQGTRAVFSIQMPDMNDLDGDGELRQAQNLVSAAQDAGIGTVVHTSVSGAGQHHQAPGWAEGRWKHMEHYFEMKEQAQSLVRQAGITHWTLLKPAFFMENFLRPSSLFAHGTEDRLATIIKPDTQVSLIAVRDIGEAAAQAITNPDRFHAVELELAGDVRTMNEIAADLGAALGVHLAAPDMTVEEAMSQGMPTFGAAYEWHNAVGQPAHPALAQELGLTVTTFAEWTKANRERI